MESFKKLWEMLGQPIRTGNRVKNDLQAAAFLGCFAALAGLVFLIENIWLKITPVSVEALLPYAVIIVTGLAVAYAAQIKKSRKMTVFFAVLFCFLTFTVAIITGRWEGAGVLWSVVLPIAMCSFVSVKYGVLLSIYYSLLYLVLFYTPLGDSVQALFPQAFVEHFPLVYMTLSLITSAAMVQYHRSALREIAYAGKLKEEVERQTQVAEDRNYRIEQMSFEALQTLAEIIDAKDPYTKGHSARVSQYSVLLARAKGWPDERVNDIRCAALLHDIGKIGIPDSILNKPQRLTEVEYEIIKTHTTMGGDILRNGLMTQVAEDVAMCHHERYDGTGYPRGLKGENISEEARLVAIADAFDTMSSNRVYRSASNRDRIRQELVTGRGKQFDPEMTDLMLDLWDRGILEPIMEENMPEEDDGMEVPSALLQEAVDSFVSQNSDDVDQLADVLKTSGSYDGALDVEYRQFAKLYEFIGNLEKRFSHPFKLILISLKADGNENVHEDELERAMYFMEKSIRQTIRNVDVLTRYDRQHFMVILLGTDDDGIRIAMDRIFRGFYKMYGSGPFSPSYTVARAEPQES